MSVPDGITAVQWRPMGQLYVEEQIPRAAPSLRVGIPTTSKASVLDGIIPVASTTTDLSDVGAMTIMAKPPIRMRGGLNL